MYKNLATLAAFALITAAGAQAQVLGCSLNNSRSCIVQGVLDADGFGVTIGPMGNGIYMYETLPFFAAQSNDTKIMNGATLLADDELGRGYDRFVCSNVGPIVCPNGIRVMPFGAATNNTVRFVVTQLN